MPRQRAHAAKKVGPPPPPPKRPRVGGSSRNPRGEEEEQEVRRFPQSIAFDGELQHKKYEDILRRKILPNRYPHKEALILVGLYDEVSTLLNKIGWENYMNRAYPTYLKPTCEFLSSYALDEKAKSFTFRLGNRDFQLNLFELNDVLEFPKGHEANIQFDKNEFWRELSGDRRAIYEARTCRESKMRSHALRYIHRVMAHTLFGRKEGDSVIPNTELQILYCLVHDQNIDLCHAIALKLKDVAQNFRSAIRIGGLVTAIARYVKFDINDMPFERVKGRDSVDIVMMQAIGIVEHVHGDYRLIPLLNEPQAPQDEEADEGSNEEDGDEVIERMENLELQMAALDVNVEDLARSVRSMNQDLQAFFVHQGFVPPSLQPPIEEHRDDRSPRD